MIENKNENSKTMNIDIGFMLKSKDGDETGIYVIVDQVEYVIPIPRKHKDLISKMGVFFGNTMLHVERDMTEDEFSMAYSYKKFMKAVDDYAKNNTNEN